MFGLIISSWPKVEGEELSSSPYMHMQFNSSRDSAESLMVITSVVFLFWVIENCKTRLSGNTDNLDLCAAICCLRLKSSSRSEGSTSEGGAPSNSTAKEWNVEIKGGGKRGLHRGRCAPFSETVLT